MLPKKKNRKLLLFCAVVLGIVLVLTNIFSFILKGFTGEGPYKRNVLNRLNSFSLGWDYFKRNPLVGVGHGNATRIVYGRNIAIHNQIIDQLASAGILGVIPLLALYIFFFRTALRLYHDAKNNEIRGFTIWITASMVHAFTELMLYRGFYSEHLPWYFAVLGILYSMQYGYKEVILKDTNKTSLLSAANEG
jgi:O-antigen ligase